METLKGKLDGRLIYAGPTTGKTRVCVALHRECRVNAVAGEFVLDSDFLEIDGHNGLLSPFGDGKRLRHHRLVNDFRHLFLALAMRDALDKGAYVLTNQWNEFSAAIVGMAPLHLVKGEAEMLKRVKARGNVPKSSKRLVSDWISSQRKYAHLWDAGVHWLEPGQYLSTILGLDLDEEWHSWDEFYECQAIALRQTDWESLFPVWAALIGHLVYRNSFQVWYPYKREEVVEVLNRVANLDLPSLNPLIEVLQLIETSAGPQNSRCFDYALSRLRGYRNTPWSAFVNDSCRVYDLTRDLLFAVATFRVTRSSVLLEKIQQWAEDLPSLVTARGLDSLSACRESKTRVKLQPDYVNQGIFEWLHEVSVADFTTSHILCDGPALVFNELQTKTKRTA